MTESCDLCYRLVDENTGIAKPIGALWSYLYHQNVQDTLLPATGTEGNMGGIMGLPNLTFSFSLGGSSVQTPTKDQAVRVCQQCADEVEELDRLHQELEGVRKLISSQVKQINRVRQNSKLSGRANGVENENLDQCWRKGISGLQTSLAGATVGKENVSQILKFLGNLCEGFVMCPASSDLYDGAISEPNYNDYTVNMNSDDDALSDQMSDIDETGADTTVTGKDFTVESVESENEDYSDCLQLQMQFDEETETSIQIVKADGGEEEDDVIDLVSDDEYDDEDFNENGTVTSSDPLTKSKETLFDANLAQMPRTRKKISNTGSEQSPITPSMATLTRVHPNSTNPVKPCELCGKLISVKQLTLHMRVHTGEKPYECEFCSRKFSQKVSLTRHRRTHNGVERLACTLCPKAFTQKASLKFHFKQVHGMELL